MTSRFQASVVTRVTAAAVNIVEHAGKIIKDVMQRGDLRIVEKLSAKDLQTEADRAAQYCIRHSFLKKFGPELCVIGEEDVESPCPDFLCSSVSTDVLHYEQHCDSSLRDVQLKDLVVWVDPVDGTAEFAQGAKEKSNLLEQVTTLIGIAYRGRPVAGVVHQPFYGWRNGAEEQMDKVGRTIWTVKGAGVHGMSITPADHVKHTIVTTRSHSNQLVVDTIEALAQEGLVDEVLRVGGAGYKIIRVLEGANAYVFASAGCKKWDTCGPEAIVAESGGHLTDVHGRCYNYDADAKAMNRAGVIATAVGTKHSRYIDAMPLNVKQALSEQ